MVHDQEVQRRMGLNGQFLLCFFFQIVSFVVAIFDLVHDVGAIHGLW